MFHPFHRAAVALLAAAPAPATPTFHASFFQHALVAVAAAAIGATGVLVILKYAKRGEVGEATNSMIVSILGSVMVVGAATLLLLSDLVVKAIAS